MIDLDISRVIGQGWTYCPRCNKESMVKVEQGWHCPWCGIEMTVAYPPPYLFWNEELTREEIDRELNHIQTSANDYILQQAKKRPPRRVRCYIAVCNGLGRVFGCEPIQVRDKRSKKEEANVRQ